MISPQKTADTPFKYCRSCYDHLAGKAGVAITDRLVKLGYLLEKDQDYEVSTDGHSFFNNFGIDTEMLSKHKRQMVRPCLDWSERRFHLAGSIGAAMLDQMMNEHWIRRVQDSRTLMITSMGKSNLYDLLGLEI